MNHDVFNGYGVPITFEQETDFLKIKETLTRIGVESKRNKSLFQSCHILHKRGYYAILHFKELFSLDGKSSDIDEIDISRRNTIVKLLNEWGLVEIVNDQNFFNDQNFLPINKVKIIPFKDKNKWNLEAKYTIGGNHE